MNQEIKELHRLDENGKPAGGETTGRGIEIIWQNGPLGRDGERKDPNGAFVEGVIAAAIGRISWYNEVGFSCAENHEALIHLQSALDALNSRTKRREAEGVEGTHAK